jgi:hypothetical protein
MSNWRVYRALYMLMWTMIVVVPATLIAIIVIGAQYQVPFGWTLAGWAATFVLAAMPRVLLAAFRCPQCGKLYQVLGNTSSDYCAHCGLPRYSTPGKRVE